MKSHRFAVFGTVVLSLLVVCGCDSVEEETPDAPLAAGEFQAEVSGMVDQELTGSASFTTGSAAPGDSPLRLNFAAGTFEPVYPDGSPGSPIETGLFITLRWAGMSGRHIVDSEAPQRCTLPSGTDFPAGYPVFCLIREGTVTITDTRADRMSGTFSLTATSLGVPAGNIQIEGSFIADSED